MKHATVKHGEFEIPLIGIDAEAVQEKCDNCNKSVHLQEIMIDEFSHFLCKECLKK